MIWLGIWLLLSVLAGMEIARVIGWGNPTPSEPELVREPVPAVGLSQHPTAILIAEVLARGRADGLNAIQLAGAVTVVLESHGLLQHEATA